MAEYDALAGLLGGDPEKIKQLLAQFQPSEDERRSARTQGLLAFGLQALATPRWNQWQGISNAALNGLGAYGGSLDQAQQQKMRSMQSLSALMDLQNKAQGLQDQQAMRSAAQQSFIPGQPGLPEMGPPTAQGEMQPPVPPTQPSMNWQQYQARIAGISPQTALAIDPKVQEQRVREALLRANSSLPAGVPPGPPPATGGAAGAMPPGVGPAEQQPGSMRMAQAQRLMANANAIETIDPARAEQMRQTAIALMPKVKEIRQQSQGGKPVDVIYYEDGTSNVVPYGTARKMVQVDQGDRKTFVDENALPNGASLGINQSPDSRASVAATIRGQNVTDTREREKMAQDNLQPQEITVGGKQVMGLYDKRKGVFLDPNTKQPMADVQPKDAFKQNEMGRQQVEMADRVLQTIQEIKPNVGFMTAGVGGAITSKIPGNPSYDIGKQLEMVKANLAFEQLSALRAASPTGGALGQVSDRENAMLSAAVAALDQAQTPSQLRANLAKVETHLNNVKRLIAQNRPQVQQAAPKVVDFSALPK